MFLPRNVCGQQYQREDRISGRREAVESLSVEQKGKWADELDKKLFLSMSQDKREAIKSRRVIGPGQNSMRMTIDPVKYKVFV